MTHRKITSFIAIMALLGFSLYASAKQAFVENIGQVTDQYQNRRPDIIAKYQAEKNLSIFLSNSGIHYQWNTGDELYRMDAKLLGANPHPRISKEKHTGFRQQYQLAEVQGIAHSYERVTYHDVYPGIDWVFYFNELGKLEHDFIIRPDAKVSDIQLQYAGADKMTIDKKGNLVSTTKYGTITEPKPYSYEHSSGRKISSAYILNGNILSFKVDKYSGTLVIDPVIDWATYFGGSEYDEIKDVKMGKDSFVYVVGSTNSTNNIATTGAHLISFQGGNNSSGADAFIAKFDTDGVCIWATYYGGTNVDLGMALAVDTAGFLYMAGRTNSQTGIATVGSHQPTKAGNASGYDAFIVKFDTSGTPLWGTYYGGNFSEGTTAIAINADRYNNIYIAGNTNSSTGISTSGAYQQTRPGAEEGFIAKFNTTGNLIWATYLGTSMNDYINAITNDTGGNVIVAGHTQGTTGLATSGTHLQTGNGGTDGFVTKFDSAGQRMWGTYFGGTGFDVLYTVTVDSLNSIYIGGMTNSEVDIATFGSHQSVIGGTGLYDACIAKLSESGTMDWSTYYGGSGTDYNYSLILSNNKLFYSGITTSSNNVATPDAINPIFNNSDAEGVLATFSTTGQRIYATYFGGDAGEVISSIAVDNNESVYLAGRTNSLTGLSTLNAHQTNFNGNQDGMLLKIKMCNLPDAASAINGNATVCESSEQQYTIPAVSGADSYYWILPNGWIGASSTDTINVIAGSDAGNIKVVAINSCGSGDTVSLAVTVRPAPQATISRNGNILTVSQTFSSYQWLLNGSPIPGAINPTHIIAQNGTYTLKVTADNGCDGVSNEIIVTNHTAINELDKIGFKFYPNPFKERLMITVPFRVTLVISDMTGKVVKYFEVSTANMEINLTDLIAGNYLLNAYSSESGELLGSTTLVKTSK